MSNKSLLFLFILLLSVSSIRAEVDNTFMEEIRSKTASEATKPEDLDRLINRLRDSPGNGSADYKNRFEAYRLISDSYAKRNHFRQAYSTYLKSLELKEQYFSERMTTAISAAQAAAAANKSKLDQEEQTTREEASDLMISSERFTTSTHVYKKFFSLGIIVLTILFAISLVRSGVRLMNMKKETEAEKTKILELHRLALAGKLVDGNIAGQQESLNSISKAIQESAEEISKLNGDTKLKSSALSLIQHSKTIQQ